MMVSTIAKTVNGNFIFPLVEDRSIAHIMIDSRRIIPHEISNDAVLFVAIEGTQYDAHEFIPQQIRKKNSVFLVNKKNTHLNFLFNKNFQRADNLIFIEVNSTVDALQKLATYHREKFSYPVIGITGSNGKTIVKEWLSHLLFKHFDVVKSPKSYNSQIGVPLSIFQMRPQHQIGIFEAGISQPEEMQNLQSIIQPTIGIFTNIGTSHDIHFSSTWQKIKEKSLLFSNCRSVFYFYDNEELKDYFEKKKRKATKENTKYIGIGFAKGATLKGEIVTRTVRSTEMLISKEREKHRFKLPFSDTLSSRNLLLCISIALELGISPTLLQDNLNSIQPVSMRLELKLGINASYLIDDSYSNDYIGLEHAIRFLQQQRQCKKKSIIISDILQDARPPKSLYLQVSHLLQSSGLYRIICIGPQLSRYRDNLPTNAIFFSSTQEFISRYDYNNFKEEAILIKGSRLFAFEKIVESLLKKNHTTALEVNLDAMTMNLAYFKSKLKPNVKLLVMIKAFAYGTGSLEVANHLQNISVDYLGVAFLDEGVMLRQNGITAPILVMNTQNTSYVPLFTYHLEPEIFNLPMLKAIAALAREKSQSLNIHLKLETGMNRLGFALDELAEAIQILERCTYLKLKSIFSHMASADIQAHDNFNHEQAKLLNRGYDKIVQQLNTKPLKHILKTSGILRFPEYQMDMVRLGIGLHGYAHTEKDSKNLVPAATLKTTISSIKKLKKGASVGYNRQGILEKDSTIATLPIGYADGFDRRFSLGVGKVWIQGFLAPTIGNICMDMCMIDITDIPCKLNDEVIIFGKDNSLIKLASTINTIPYEILCKIGHRVKRVFYSES